MLNETRTTISFLMMLWCLLSLVTQTLTTPANLINFGGSTEESKEAAYYLAADSGYPNTGPTDELKRTQRSFWKKLFKNGLFDDGDNNCCNNCQYNIGDGNGNTDYNGVFPNWQPFRPFQPWRAFPHIFGGNFANRCGGCSAPNPAPYSNNYGADSYNNGANANVPSVYNNNVNPAPDSYNKPEEPVYETPASPPPAETGNYVENPPSTYEKPPENEYSNNKSSYDSNDKSSASQYTDKGQYSNTKIPQIVYQPIIYVSPQYHDQASNKLKQNSNNYVSESNLNVLSPASESYASETPVEIEQTQYNSPALKSYNTPAAQYSYAPCAPSSPSVSTVSTVYTVVTPSLSNSPPQQSVQSVALAPQQPYTNSGPSKYSLYPASGFPAQEYSEYKSSSLPARAPGPVLYSKLTLDDQPYRDCPELFSDYNRRHNSILSYPAVNSGNPGRSGNTFINSQVISY